MQTDTDKMLEIFDLSPPLRDIKLSKQLEISSFSSTENVIISPLSRTFCMLIEK